MMSLEKWAMLPTTGTDDEATTSGVVKATDPFDCGGADKSDCRMPSLGCGTLIGDVLP